MTTRLSGLRLCAGLLALGLCSTDALATPDPQNLSTYTGDGTLYGLSPVLEPFLEAEEILESVDLEAYRVKGEFLFSEDGDLIEGNFEGGQLQLRINQARGEVFNFVVSVGDERRVFGLTDIVGLQDADTMTLEGLVIGDGFNTAVSIDLDSPDVQQGGVPESEALGVIGPDVTASRLGLVSSGSSDDFHYWGTAGGIRAFSIASTSCNIGDQTAEWISGGSGRHPLIGQNVYRLLDGKFEQIGQSWLKHSFCAVSEPTCGSCSGTPCDSLGIGCADTYWATLNDGQDGGAKSDINAQGLGTSGGSANTHNHPYTTPSGDPAAIRGRLQIHDADIQAGGQFFAEIQYVTHDEDPSVRFNNASYRDIGLTLTNMWGLQSGQNSVKFKQAAINAWAAAEGATVKSTDVPGESRGSFNYGYRVTDNGDGTWHYEFALHNLNSDRSAGSFSVPIGANVSTTNIGFHDVDYHSGEPYDGTDWDHEFVQDNGTTYLRWSTDDHATNPNANALRWGTLYNFRFDANSAPETGSVVIGLFKPGTPDSVSFSASAAPQALEACTGDVNGDGLVDASDLALVLGSWESANPAADINGDGIVDPNDLALLLGNWGPCA